MKTPVTILIDGHAWAAIRTDRAPTAGNGHQRPFTGTMPNVWLLIRNPTFAPIAAAQNDLFLTYVGFAI